MNSMPGTMSMPGMMSSLGSFPGLNIMENMKETVMKAAERAKAQALPPGTAWGSRIVPDKLRKYDLPDKLKHTVKEETKVALKQPSKLGKLKKEEAYVKDKNPPIPPHKVAKKPATGVDGQENSAQNKTKPSTKLNNVVVHSKGAGSKGGSINAFDPLAAISA